MNRIRCASMIILVFAAGVAVAAAAEAGRTASPEANAVAFAAPWTSPFHVDP